MGVWLRMAQVALAHKVTGSPINGSQPLPFPLEVSFLYKSDFSIGPVLFLLPLMAFDSGISLELLPRHRSLFWQPCNARLLSGF